MARQVAHEIKNPLTPIQLSAERLQHKLSDKLNEHDQAMLARSTQTIVNQVEAMKNLVNSFRDYAKLPPPKLLPLDLNALVREVLVLYEGSRIPVSAQSVKICPPLTLTRASCARCCTTCCRTLRTQSPNMPPRRCQY
jgi:nitrogen fixation/metabolism regulation signal transduction histidine kinase